jgi:Uma2 family endonuclease
MSTTTLYTAADLLKMPENRVRYELVEGELRTTTPASGALGLVTGRLFGELFQHVRAQALGELFTEATGFQLRRNPDTVRAPDIAFVRAERLPPEGIGPGFLELAPDLAVEVVSPSDTVSELGEKVGEYLDVGVRAIWVVDPANRTVTTHEAGRNVRLLREDDMLEGGAVVPGFQYSVAALFAGSNWHPVNKRGGCGPPVPPHTPEYRHGDT